MIQRILAIAVFLMLGLTASSVQGATAISYSEPDNTYGWCAGYSTSEAPGCARQWCVDSNGSDCKLALVCDAGWNAVAFADSDEATGFGGACDLDSAFFARTAALALCVVKSRTVCWTDGTFDGSGTERSKDDNKTFDLTWYIQGLLTGLSYDPGTIDGEFGSKTRSAIRAFQKDMGLTESGEVSEDLFYMLLAANGGISYLIGGMESLASSLSADETARTFAAAHAPNPGMTLSDELGIRNTAVQRVVLADYLRFNKRDCPGSATRAERTVPEDGVWTVSCSNGGSFTITLSADGNSDLIRDNNNNAPAPSTDVAQTTTNATTTTTTAGANGIAFSHSKTDDAWAICTGDIASSIACAQEDCKTDYNGAACETVLSCPDRLWSAAAVTDSGGLGVGFACGFTNAVGARETALAECIHKTNSTCKISATIDPEGTVRPTEENDAFTMIHKTQTMLVLMGFYDGVLTGENSQALSDAAKTFQTELGFEATGVVDSDLEVLAYFGGLGEARYVYVMSRDIYGGLDPGFANFHYGYSKEPAAEVSFNDEVAAMSDEGQRYALATAISAIDTTVCTLPATSVKRVDPAGTWEVQCAEGPLEVVFSGYDMVVNSVVADTPAQTPPPPPTPSKEKREKTKG